MLTEIELSRKRARKAARRKIVAPTHVRRDAQVRERTRLQRSAAGWLSGLMGFRS